MRIGDARFWCNAAVSDQIPYDLILGRNNRLLSPLLRQALPDKDINLVLKEIEEECQILRQEEMDIAAVSTRTSAKAQEKDKEIQDDGFSFDFDESFFQQSKTRSKKSKKQKREDALRAVQRSGTELPPYGKEQLVKEQNVDETIQPIWRDLRQNHSTMYVVEEDILYKKGTDKVGQEILRLVVPSSKRGHLLKLSHTSLADAHVGRNRTLERLHRSFFWPGMTTDVRLFVKECVECQKGNVGKHDRVPMEMMPVVQTPFEILAADIVGPLPITKRKNRYILTVMDLSTRYPEATPLKQATSTAIHCKKKSVQCTPNMVCYVCPNWNTLYGVKSHHILGVCLTPNWVCFHTNSVCFLTNFSVFSHSL